MATVMKLFTHPYRASSNFTGIACNLLSQPCRAVHLFLTCSGVQFEVHNLDILKAEHRGPEFLKINPYHKFPVIVDDGFCLAESSAIMRYAAVKYNLADHWYPRADAKKQARVDEFLHWQQSAIRAHGVTTFLGMYRDRLDFNSRLKKQPMDEAKIKAAREEIIRGFTHIADYFLQDDQPFIAGDEISAADILGACEIYQLQGVDQLDGLLKSNPKVKAWMERVAKALEPEWSKANVIINSRREKYLNSF